MKRVKSIILIIFSLFLFSGFLVGQETEQEEQVLLHGVVVDASTHKPIPDVHYIIANLFSGATSVGGKFSMYINRYDTVVFSFVGYSDFLFSLSDTLIGKSFVAGIFLQTDTLSIGEVIVLPRLGDLRTEFRTTEIEVSQELVNAKNNLKVATYQGLNSEASLGDPATNYEMIKRKQVITAFEKGGIPSDQMLGLDFISMIPMAIFLLKNGLPEKPEPPAPHVSDRELDKMIDLYKKKIKSANEK
jgi:hypothetical protein